MSPPQGPVARPRRTRGARVALAAMGLIALLLTTVVNAAVRYVAGLAREWLGDVIPSHLLGAAVEWGLAPAALLVTSAVVVLRTTTRAAIRRERAAAGPPGDRGSLHGRPTSRLERT